MIVSRQWDKRWLHHNQQRDKMEYTERLSPFRLKVISLSVVDRRGGLMGGSYLLYPHCEVHQS